MRMIDKGYKVVLSKTSPEIMVESIYIYLAYSGRVSCSASGSNSTPRTYSLVRLSIV